MASYKELKKQAEALLRQAEEAFLVERAEGIRQVKEFINEFQLTASDIGLVKTEIVKARKDPKKKTFPVKLAKVVAPPKYRDPESGRTWSGRGHQPQWIVGNRDEYLIEEPEQKAA
jgi:DNA-binding protein H-NS